MKTLGSIAQAIHLFWVDLPPALQAAIVVVLMAVYQFALGYSWTLPTTWGALVTETSTFFLALLAVVYPLVTTKVWPAIVPWLLSLLGLSALTVTKPTSDPQIMRLVVHWARAA